MPTRIRQINLVLPGGPDQHLFFQKPVQKALKSLVKKHDPAIVFRFYKAVSTGPLGSSRVAEIPSLEQRTLRALDPVLYNLIETPAIQGQVIIDSGDTVLSRLLRVERCLVPNVDVQAKVTHKHLSEMFDGEMNSWRLLSNDELAAEVGSTAEAVRQIRLDERKRRNVIIADWKKIFKKANLEYPRFLQG